jgi:hypothetical protein
MAMATALGLVVAAPSAGAYFGEGSGLLRASYLSPTTAFPSDAADVAIDADGNVIVATSFRGALDPAVAGGGTSRLSSSDIIVAKFTPDLTRILAAKSIGGTSDEAPTRVVLANGSVYVTGTTASSDFPSAGGVPGVPPATPTKTKAFVVRLSADLATLQSSTLIGGSDEERGLSIAAGPDGSIYVLGESRSSDLPALTGAAMATGDRFVMRLNATLSAFLQATRIGGSAATTANALAVTSGGDVVVAGETLSRLLPATAGSAQPVNASPPAPPPAEATTSASPDGFVMRLDATLRSVIRSTFLGGSGGDSIVDIAFDARDGIYVLGQSGSESIPATAGAAHPLGWVGRGGFVSRLPGDLSSFVRTSYFSDTSGYSIPRTLQVEADGGVLISGQWDATGDYVPGLVGYFMRLSPDLAIERPVAAIMLGTSDTWRVALADAGVYVAGVMNGASLFATQDAAIAMFEVPDRAASFVARFSSDLLDTASARGPELHFTPSEVQLGPWTPGVPSAVAHVDVENSGQSPIRFGSVSIETGFPGFEMLGTSCVEDAIMQAGDRCAVRVRFKGGMEGAGGTYLHVLVGGVEVDSALIKGPPGPLSVAYQYVIEYYHPGFDHYFMTADLEEIAALDAGRFSGWRRTGAALELHANDPYAYAPLSPVCRFYLPPGYGDSHFYTALPQECAAVQAQYPWFILERTDAFRTAIPQPTTGECPVARIPVYRVWNRSPATNHRYTTDSRVRDRMGYRGWIREGYGTEGVVMCVPYY